MTFKKEQMNMHYNISSFPSFCISPSFIITVFLFILDLKITFIEKYMVSPCHYLPYSVFLSSLPRYSAHILCREFCMGKVNRSARRLTFRVSIHPNLFPEVVFIYIINSIPFHFSYKFLVLMINCGLLLPPFSGSESSDVSCLGSFTAANCFPTLKTIFP